MTTRPLCLLALAACAAPTHDTAPEDTAGDDTATPADTSDTDDPAVNAGPCPAYTNFGRQGAVRTWESTEAFEATRGYSGTWTMTTTRLTADGDVEVVAEHQYSNGVDSSYVWTWRCDAEGAWLRSLKFETEYTSDGVSQTWTTDTTYTAPYLTVAAGLAVGVSWTTPYDNTSTSWSSSTGETTTTSTTGTQTYTAVAATTRTVPAGTFDVLEIDSVTNTSDGAIELTWWADAGLGTVATETSELTGWSE